MRPRISRLTANREVRRMRRKKSMFNRGRNFFLGVDAHMNARLITLILLASMGWNATAEEALFAVCKEGLWGMIDASGRLVVSPQFDEVWRPYNPLIPISLKDHACCTVVEDRVLVRKGEQWGYIDRTGTWVIPARFTHATHFQCGRAGVMLDGRWSFIDPQGNLLLSINGAQGGYLFSEGLAAVLKTEEHRRFWGFVDEKGRETIPARFSEVRSFHEGLAPAREGSDWGYLNQVGQWVIKAQFQDADYFFDGLARVVQDGKAGFLRQDGTWAIAPQYQQVQRFAEGLAAVSDGKMCGFVDSKGQVRISLTFSDARSFRHGLAAVAQGQRYGFIDRDGNWVVKPEYEAADDFSEGLAGVARDGRFGFIDQKGTVVVPFEFDEVRPFTDGLAEVRIDEKWGYIDHGGKYVWTPSD